MEKISKTYLIILFLTIIFNNNFSSALKCIECGNKEKDCTVAPENILKKTDCEEKEHQCFTKLKAEDGTIERGCGKDNCKDQENCFECKDDKGEKTPCNSQIIPKERPKCYVCDGEDCLKIDETKIKIEYCQYFNKDNKNHCFTKTIDKKVTRGCLEKTEINCIDCKNCTNTEIDKPCNKDDVTPPSDDFSCYECRSDAFEDCVDPEKNKETVAKKKCKEGAIGCYAEYWSGKTFRACAEILNEKETKSCKENKDNCVY